MSRQAIAAVLARTDLASGERLVALSLASFAGRDSRAWPGAPAASARAGLSRSRYLQARGQLVARGLVAVDERATGRGRASIVTLVLADTGPWWDGEINVELFEAVLAYSPACGPERLLLATMAAVADEEGAVRDLSTPDLCTAAGIADRTYRRARKALLASGSVKLVNGVGGRGNTNVWTVCDPRRTGNSAASRVQRRLPPLPGARPLMVSAASAGGGAQVDGPATEAAEKRGQDRTIPAEKHPILTEVSAQKRGHDGTVPAEKCPVVSGVLDAKGGQAQTLFKLASTQSPAQTPARTPAPNAPAGREPLNPRTREDPPSPPEGGSPPDSILIEETYVTARGRMRRRAVRIDLDEVRRNLELPRLADHTDWDQMRRNLREILGDSRFEIWLEPLELIAIDRAGALVIDAPPAMVSWPHDRYGRVIASCAESASRQVRFANPAERRALVRGEPAAGPGICAAHTNRAEVS